MRGIVIYKSKYVNTKKSDELLKVVTSHSYLKKNLNVFKMKKAIV